MRHVKLLNPRKAVFICLWLLVSASADAGITDAVVRVFANNSAGCGTLIHSENHQGYVLTAAHVIERGGAIRTTWHDGTTLAAQVIVSDRQLDIALLSVTTPDGATSIPLASNDQWPPQGEAVELIGYGGGNLRHWQATVNGYVLTDGIGKSQTLSLDTRTIGGDSGGAIVYRGRLVGVIWGGPLAGPRGPMLATHGTCCVAINALLEGKGIRLDQPALTQFGPPACRGPVCPLPRRIPVQKPIPITPSPDTKQLITRIAQLEAELAALQRHPNLHINIDDVSNQLIEHIAVDPRFRGPPGRDGADGSNGRDAGNVDVDRLAERVKQRLAGSIRIRVRPATR